VVLANDARGLMRWHRKSPMRVARGKRLTARANAEATAATQFEERTAGS
jgi:hypothetical protein